MGISQQIKTPSGSLEVFDVKPEENKVRIEEKPQYDNYEGFIAKEEPPFITRVSMWILSVILTYLVGRYLMDRLVDYLFHRECRAELTFIVGLITGVTSIPTFEYLYRNGIKKFINKAILRGRYRK